MKKFSFGAIALVALNAGTAALAADLQAKAPVYKAPPPIVVYNWTGFYLGANLGYSFGRASTDWTIAGVSFGSTSQKMEGILGGLQAGYNWQSSNWVLGLETDIQATAQRGSSSLTDAIPGTPGTPAIPCIEIDPPAPACIPGTGIPATPGTPAITGVATNTAKLPWLGTVRARLGVTPSDRWLVYATGGLAYGEIEADGTLTTGGTVVAATTNRWHAGWTVGGGIEAALWDNWTFKLEYLYVDLGSVGSTFTGIAPFTPITTSNHVTDNIVRAGINYRFSSGPVVARY